MPSPRLRALASASALAIAAPLLGASPAAANEAPANGVAEVVVTGQAYAAQRSINTKRNADVVSDTIASSEIGQLPDFGLGEALLRIPGVSFVINNGRGEAQFQTVRGLYALAGLRYEHTRQSITNYQPSPITSTSTSNFAPVNTSSTYDKLLPSLNLSYDVTSQLKLRAAVSRTLARPRYSDMAQNSALTFSGNQATETIANPNLKPREATNYDLSLEFYPQAGTSFSIAGFHKDIAHEIFALTSTVQNTTIPGLPGSNYTVVTTTPTNTGSARIDGVEFGFVKSRLEFLPGPLKGLGFSANATLISMTAPSIQMGDKVTFRRLPQLLESSKDVENAALFYSSDRWGAQVSYNHTGKMPITFDTTNAVNDQWWAATDTVDAQLSYRPWHGMEFRLQAKNLTDNKPQKVVGPGQTLNYSLLDNGRAYYLGVSFAY